MAVPASLIHLAQPWASAYSDSAVLRVAVLFAHVGALLLGGGLAVAADRGTLRALRRGAERRDGHLTELAAVHRWVASALALSLASGVLLFLSDVETFAGSVLFWIKLALVALLLVNGFLMTRAEGTLDASAGADDATWRQLRRYALLSLTLWFATTLAGVAVANAG